jgi:hypothetical protein
MQTNAHSISLSLLLAACSGLDAANPDVSPTQAHADTNASCRADPYLVRASGQDQSRVRLGALTGGVLVWAAAGRVNSLPGANTIPGATLTLQVTLEDQVTHKRYEGKSPGPLALADDAPPELTLDVDDPSHPHSVTIGWHLSFGPASNPYECGGTAATSVKAGYECLVTASLAQTSDKQHVRLSAEATVPSWGMITKFFLGDPDQPVSLFTRYGSVSATAEHKPLMPTNQNQIAGDLTFETADPTPIAKVPFRVRYVDQRDLTSPARDCVGRLVANTK